MIDILATPQLYKWYEIFVVGYIQGVNYSFDGLKKLKHNGVSDEFFCTTRMKRKAEHCIEREKEDIDNC